MENADTAVLSSVESDLLHPGALDLGLHRAVERITRPRADDTETAGELRSLEQELARLTEAIAAGGGSVPALLVAVQSREARRRELLARRETRRVELIDPVTVRADLEQRLLDWRSLIQDRATHGRRLLKQLIVGRLDIMPNLEERYYDFRGTGTLLPVISGVVPQSMASPPGFVPTGTTEGSAGCLKTGVGRHRLSQAKEMASPPRLSVTYIEGPLAA